MFYIKRSYNKYITWYTILVLSSNVINVILITGELPVDVEDDAPEESVEDEDGEGDEEPDNVGQVHIAQVVVPEEDGETDDDWEGETAHGEDAVEEEPGEEGRAVASESPADQDTVDCDGQQGEDHLAGQGCVGLPSLLQLRSVPQTQNNYYHFLLTTSLRGLLRCLPAYQHHYHPN